MSWIKLLASLLLICWMFVPYASGSCSTYSGNATVNATGTCRKCVGESLNCYWCSSSYKCAVRPTDFITGIDCAHSEWYSWGQCTVSGFNLVIQLPLGLLCSFLILGLCVYHLYRSGQFKKCRKAYRKRKRLRRLNHEIGMKHGFVNYDNPNYDSCERM